MLLLATLPPLWRTFVTIEGNVTNQTLDGLVGKIL